MTDENKICFVIAPIGQDGTDTRKRSDQVFKHILAPASKECGFEAIRADHIKEPGIITSQVIQHIIDDPIVIADLTERNPNVFYELAIRHALRKPFVQIIQQGEEKPFDVAGIRTIEVDHHDLDSALSAKKQIISQIESIKTGGYEVSSPISTAVDTELLRGSAKPEQRQLADVLFALVEMRLMLSSMNKRLDVLPNLCRRQNSNSDSKILGLLDDITKLNRISIDKCLRLRELSDTLSRIVDDEKGDGSRISLGDLKALNEELDDKIVQLGHSNQKSLELCNYLHEYIRL